MTFFDTGSWGRSSATTMVSGTDLVVSSSRAIYLDVDTSSGSSDKSLILYPAGTLLTIKAGRLLLVIQSVSDCPKFVSEVIKEKDASSGSILSNVYLKIAPDDDSFPALSIAKAVKVYTPLSVN